MEQMRRSLEELFSDFSPPPPEGSVSPEPEPKRTPPSPAPGAPAPPPAEKAPPTRGEETLADSRGLAAMYVRNIRSQLLGNALIILTMLLWIAFLAGSETVRLNQAMARLAEEMMRVNAALVVGEKVAHLLTTIGYGTIKQDTQDFIQSIEEARTGLGDAQNRLLESAASLPTQAPLWAELTRLQVALAQMDPWITLVSDLARRGEWDYIRFYQTYLFPYYSGKISGAIVEIERQTTERLATANAEVATARTMLRNVVFAWGSFLVLVILGVNASLLRSVAEPVESISRAAMQLAAGRLETRIVAARADEFGRLASAFNEMADRLQALYNELEDRVRERTRALQEANYVLQRRAIQLEASAEVSRAITSIFNVDELFRRAVNLIRDRFGFYHAGIFLMDETGEWAVLREATGEVGVKMKAHGHRLRVGETSMVGWAALHRHPRIALDVGKDAVHFANPLLPYTRSEMTLPLMVGGRLLGVLDIQSTEEAAFDEDDIRTLQSMADQLAIAIENARRFSDEALLLEATSPIFLASRLLSTATNLEQVGQAVITSIAETGADGCFLALLEPPEGQPEIVRFVTTWRLDGKPPILPGMRIPVTMAHLRLEMMQQLWSVSDIHEPSHLSKEDVEFFRWAGVRAVANIPLRIGERPLGFIVAYRFSPGAFTASAIRLYEALTDMASVAVERVRLTEALQQRARQEETLRFITDQITGTFDLQRMLQTTMSQLSEALKAQGAYVELGVR